MAMAVALLPDHELLLAHTAFGGFQWVNLNVLAVLGGALNMSCHVAGAHPPFHLRIWHDGAEFAIFHR